MKKKASVKTATGSPFISVANADSTTTSGCNDVGSGMASSHGNRGNRGDRPMLSAVNTDLVRTLTGYAYKRVNQGTAIIRLIQNTGGPRKGHFYHIDMPDNSVYRAASKPEVKRIVTSWARRKLRGIENAVGLLRLEWR